MKTSDEMLQSLLKRREQYISEQKEKKKRRIKVTASFAICFSAAALVSVAAAHIFPGDDTQILPVITENMTSAANTETITSVMTTENSTTSDAVGNTRPDVKEHTTPAETDIQITLFRATAKSPDTDAFGEDELTHVDVILDGNRLYEQIPESDLSLYGLDTVLHKSDFGDFIGTVTEIGPYAEEILSSPCSQEPSLAGCDVYVYKPVHCDAMIIVRDNNCCSVFRFTGFTEEGFCIADNYRIFNVLSGNDILRIDYEVSIPDGTWMVTKKKGSITAESDLLTFFDTTAKLQPFARESALSGDPDWLNEARETYKEKNNSEKAEIAISLVLKNGLTMHITYQPNLGTGYIPGHFFLSEEENAVMRKMFQE